MASTRSLSYSRLPVRGLRRRAAKLARDERGFTIPELLVATMLMVIVMALLMQPIITAPKIANRDLNRAWSIQDVQNGLYQMTRDLRQAQLIYAAGANSLDFKLTAEGVTTRVLYKCDFQPGGQTYRQCVRASSTTLTAPPSTTNAKDVVNRLLNNTTSDPNDPVFATKNATTGLCDFAVPPTTTSTYVCAHLVVPSNANVAGSYRQGYQYLISLDDGAYIRNLGTQ